MKPSEIDKINIFNTPMSPIVAPIAVLLPTMDEELFGCSTSDASNKAENECNNTINSTSSDVGSTAYSSETVVASVGSVGCITGLGRALLDGHLFMIPEMIPHKRLPYCLFSDLFVD